MELLAFEREKIFSQGLFPSSYDEFDSKHGHPIPISRLLDVQSQLDPSSITEWLDFSSGLTILSFKRLG